MSGFKMNTSKKILIILSVFLFLFVLAMIVIFCIKDSIPDTLVTCVFAACTGELSVLGWIKNTKTKYLNEGDYEDDGISD